MQEHAARHAKDDERDPFYLKSSKHLERLAMEEAGLIPHLVLPQGPLPIARDSYDPQLPGMSRTVAHRASESEQLWVRFGMAAAGGLVLIVPMLIMANLESKTASLITTGIAMFLFAAGITFGTRLKPDQVLGTTAAYVAVLVVFVGTSLSN
jgi:VIT1/CCC1 family predicted Fe2+/Mn2+ transporter